MRGLACGGGGGAKVSQGGVGGGYPSPASAVQVQVPERFEHRSIAPTEQLPSAPVQSGTSETIIAVDVTCSTISGIGVGLFCAIPCQ